MKFSDSDVDYNEDRVTEIIFDPSGCNGEENSFECFLHELFPNAKIKQELGKDLFFVDGEPLEDSGDIMHEAWDDYCDDGGQ